MQTQFIASAEKIQNQIKEHNEQSQLLSNENKTLHEEVAKLSEQAILRQKYHANEVLILKCLEKEIFNHKPKVANKSIGT